MNVQITHLETNQTVDFPNASTVYVHDEVKVEWIDVHDNTIIVRTEKPFSAERAQFPHAIAIR